MIIINELLNENLIIPELKAKTKDELFDEMTEVLYKNNLVKNKKQLINSLMEREKIETTGVGHGIAIPHARTESVDGLIICFGLSKQGINFDSLDQKPVHIIFLIASNEESKNKYIQLLARISRICRKATFREKIIKANNAMEILNIFKEEESL